MKESSTWSSKFTNSLWSETDETWEESHEDWRIVGSNPFERRTNSATPATETDTLYIIEFPSGRLNVACSGSKEKIGKNTHVVLEADRGEDCGIVKGYTTRRQLDDLIKRYKAIEKDLNPKRIYRLATEEDLKKLEETRAMNPAALAECKKCVKSLALDMEVIDCEYQFDRNKIIFFFVSDKRIDFRDLVKELYKIFKTRIWMCSVEKSIDGFLCEILE